MPVQSGKEDCTNRAVIDLLVANCGTVANQESTVRKRARALHERGARERGLRTRPECELALGVAPDGKRVHLRRFLLRQWRLQASETGLRFVDIRISGASSAPTMRELPAPTAEPHVVVLTACAVLMLERTLPVAMAHPATG
jgi:hypothetical protein